MTPAHQYITTLLERLPSLNLATEEQRMAFDRIKNKLTSASDIMDELRTLYKVNNLSDFALSLMWIVENVEKNPSRVDPKAEEESLVFSMFQKAESTPPEVAASSSFDAVSPAAEPQPPGAFESLPPVESPPTAEAGPLNADSVFGIPEEPSPQNVFEAVPTEQTGTPEPEAAADLGTLASETPPFESPTPPSFEAPSPAQVAGGDEAARHEQLLAKLFERFIEALQTAAEDRMNTLEELKKECEVVKASESFPGEYKQYCQLLMDLVNYLANNQMLDDIRAMNMLSNAYDPFSVWANTDPGNRTGLLDQGLETLRSFKALFE